MKILLCQTAAILLLFVGSTRAPAQEMNTLSFLTGQWIEKTERDETQESWLGPQGDVMVGVNLSLRNNRAGFEFLRIVKRDGKLVYLASPSGRQPATEFGLKEATATTVTFENPAHDFPQRVMYKREGDTLIARIEGSIGGQERSKEWRFKKAK